MSLIKINSYSWFNIMCLHRCLLFQGSFTYKFINNFHIKINYGFARSCLCLNNEELYPSLGCSNFLVNIPSFRLKFYQYSFMFLKLFLLKCCTVGIYNWDYLTLALLRIYMKFRHKSIIILAHHQIYMFKGLIVNTSRL